MTNYPILFSRPLPDGTHAILFGGPGTFHGGIGYLATIEFSIITSATDLKSQFRIHQIQTFYTIEEFVSWVRNLVAHMLRGSEKAQ